MQHLTEHWSRTAASDEVQFLLLDPDDIEGDLDLLRSKGVTAFRQESTPWGKEVMTTLTADRGFTFRDKVGDAPKSGFMVSVSKHTEKVIPVRDITGADIADYATVHQQELRDPKVFLGAWVWRGKVYLDVSMHVADKETALRLARENEQIGVYDIGVGKTIVVATGQYEASLRPTFAVLTSQSYDDFAASLRGLP